MSFSLGIQCHDVSSFSCKAFYIAAKLVAKKKWCHQCCVARLRVSHPTEKYSQKGEQKWVILIPWLGLHLAWGWVWNPDLFLPEKISTGGSPVHRRTAHPRGKQEEPELEKTISSRVWDAFSSFHREQGGFDSHAPHLRWLRYPLGHKDRKDLKYLVLPWPQTDSSRPHLQKLAYSRPLVVASPELPKWEMWDVMELWPR